MPGVANYTGGSRHHLAAARRHPERATQRRYFAEHRHGPELGQFDADRRKERTRLDFAWARPGDRGKEAVEGMAPPGTSKRPAAAQVDEGEQARSTRPAPPPAKKARMSTILQALDDDPVVSFDLHRRRLLAEDDWAGLDITVDRSPLRRSPDDVDVDRKAGVAEPAWSSHKTTAATPLAERQPPRRDQARVHVARAASPPSSTRLTLSDRDLDADIDTAGDFKNDDGAFLAENVYGAGEVWDEYEDLIRAHALSSAGAWSKDGAHTGSPSTRNVGDDRNLERLAFSPPASTSGSIRPTLADNPHSIFPAVARPASSASTAARSSPAPSSVAARPHRSSLTPTSRSSGTAPSARRSTGRLNESITSRIIDGKEPLRASLATLVLDFPTSRQGVAQPKYAAPSTRAFEEHDKVLSAPREDNPDDPPPLPNPFRYLAAALKLQDLVGSSSSDG